MVTHQPVTPQPDPVTDDATLCGAFQRIAVQAPDAVALRAVEDGVVITWSQYAQRVRTIAAGLARLGVGRGDTVGLMMCNRPEFHLVDTATMHLGAVPYSIYNTDPPEVIHHVLTNAGSRVVVCDAQYSDVLRRSGYPIKNLVCTDSSDGEDSMTLQRLEDAPQRHFDFEAAWRAVRPDDIATLIYTSGTTGQPKGVELTHGNIMAQARAVAAVFGPRSGDRCISYLPTAHIADRFTCHYVQLRFGAEVSCIADPRAVVSALRSVQPTIWMAVPRIWQKLQVVLRTALQNDPATAESWQPALERALHHRRAERAGEPVPEALSESCRDADAAIFAPLREAFGLGHLRLATAGAAAMDVDLLEFFEAIGVHICEVWGLSENVGLATMNAPGSIKIGTVGRPLPGVELKIAEDGEAFLRGAVVMGGYRGDPERTVEVLDADGWLATGDVVTQDSDGYVSIVGRKKELIINSAGKNMSPTNIENALTNACPLIGNVIVIGDARPFNVALVVLDPEVLAGLRRHHAIEETSSEALSRHAAIVGVVEAGVTAANQKLARVEQIKRFQILPDQWLPGGKEVTATLKLRRDAITKRYATVIDYLYSDGYTEPAAQ